MKFVAIVLAVVLSLSSEPANASSWIGRVGTSVADYATDNPVVNWFVVNPGDECSAHGRMVYAVKVGGTMAAIGGGLTWLSAARVTYVTAGSTLARVGFRGALHYYSATIVQSALVSGGLSGVLTWLSNTKNCLVYGKK